MSLYLIIWSRTLIGILLTAAAVLKMIDFVSFRAAVRGFALVPERFTFAVASTLLFLEAVTGQLILVAVVFNDAVVRWACIGGVLLFLVFSMAIAINLARGRRNISCGCFATTDENGISWLLVVRNAVLCVIALCGFPLVHDAAWREHGYGGGRLETVLIAVSVLLACKLCSAIRRLRGYERDLIPHGGFE
jgi:hypothetical protein